MRHTVLGSIGICGLLVGCLLAPAGNAQTGGEGLSPTLAAIKNGHVVHLGYRESSPPFSFLDQANRPIGYSLELCEAIVEEIGVEVDDPNLKIVTAPDHEQSYQMLVDGKADAFATDDILLYGLIARHKSQDKFRVTGDYLSYDPYGIMFPRGEPQLTAVVERTFRKLGTNHDLVPLYHKWFVSRLPTGERLNVAISPQLEDAFKALDDSEGVSN